VNVWVRRKGGEWRTPNIHTRPSSGSRLKSIIQETVELEQDGAFPGETTLWPSYVGRKRSGKLGATSTEPKNEAWSLSCWPCGNYRHFSNQLHTLRSPIGEPRFGPRPVGARLTRVHFLVFTALMVGLVILQGASLTLETLGPVNPNLLPLSQQSRTETSFSLSAGLTILLFSPQTRFRGPLTPPFWRRGRFPLGSSPRGSQHGS